MTLKMLRSSRAWGDHSASMAAGSVLILDHPPPLKVLDAAAHAASCDGVVLVILIRRSGHGAIATKFTKMLKRVEQLHEEGAFSLERRIKTIRIYDDEFNGATNAVEAAAKVLMERAAAHCCTPSNSKLPHF